MVEDAWKNFELSGKIADYLSYKQAVTKDSQKKQEFEAGYKDRGIGSYGTEHCSDRDNIKCNAHWRV